MPIISEETVDDAWQTVGDFEAEQAADEMQRISDANPELLAFVSVLSEDMSDEAQELAYYIFVVVYTMFDSEYEGVPEISHETVAEQYDKAADALNVLAEANESDDDEGIDLASVQKLTHQPNVMKYVVESLTESQDGDDPIELTDDEFGGLMLILKTVVDTLHEATSNVLP